MDNCRKTNYILGIIWSNTYYIRYLTDHQVIRFWNASGSCFWGPFLAYIILATGLYKKVPELPIFDKLRNLLSQKKI